MLSSDFDTGTGTTFKATDLGDNDWELTIKGMTKHEFTQTNRESGESYKEWKPIFSFEEDERTFVCNKSNRKILTAAWGNDMLSWTGKTVILYAGVWPSGDKGIMVRIPKKAIKPGKPYDKAKYDERNPPSDLNPVKRDPDDGIPF
jgi:hypothetical protein